MKEMNKLNEQLKNIKKEEDSTKDELLKEVKELRKEVTEDNKKKQQNSAYNSMMVIGIILIAVAFFLWKCTGIF